METVGRPTELRRIKKSKALPGDTSYELRAPCDSMIGAAESRR